MRAKKSSLEKLTAKQIETITERAERKKNVPKITSQQVNMRMDSTTLNRIKELAEVQGIPYTTYLTRLLREDIDRLWDIYQKVS